MKGGDGKGLKVEQGSWGRELFWEDEVLEGYRESGLCVEPRIRDYGDEVVGRDWLIHRNGERDGVFVLCEASLEKELVVEEDNFAIDVFDHDPEHLGVSVDLFVPPEVGRDDEVDSE